MSRDPATLAADEEPRVQAEVQRAAVRQLLAGGPFAESLHILLVSVVAALVWNTLPRAVTVGWAGAVTAAATRALAPRPSSGSAGSPARSTIWVAAPPAASCARA